MNQDQPAKESNLSSGRSRGLLTVVIVGVILMVILAVTIAALFLSEIFFEDGLALAGSSSSSIAEIQPTLDQSSNLLSEATATESPAQNVVEEVIRPTASEDYSLLQPKQIVAGSPKIRPSWTATPIPTDTPTPTPSPVPTFVSDGSGSNLLRPATLGIGEKWIDVNLTSQTLVAFEGSAPVFQSLISSGTSAHPTVTGQFRIWLRFSSQDMNGRRLGYDYFLKDVPYVQYFYQDYALHGTFWHNNFGTPMSHGCVNLPTPSAEWLFDWASNGTLVNVHN